MSTNAAPRVMMGECLITQTQRVRVAPSELCTSSYTEFSGSEEHDVLNLVFADGPLRISEIRVDDEEEKP